MLRLAWLAMALVPGSAWAQVYLIAGTPTPKEEGRYAATLVRVDSDGKVSPADELVSKEDSIDWLAINYELKTAVIVARDASIVVLGLDSAEAIKRCTLTAGNMLQSYWLANVPGKGPVFEWEGLRGAFSPESVEADEMLLDASVSCELSFQPPAPRLTDARYIMAHGTSGVGDLSLGDGIGVWVSGDGKVSSGNREYFDVAALPSDLAKTANASYVVLILDNSYMLALATGVGDGKTRRTLVFRKGDRSWHVAPIPGDGCNCREFGKFIAITEERTKKAVIEQIRAHPGNISFDDHVLNDEHSAGSADWRRTETNNGPDQEESFKNSAAIFPGRLHLYNIETERLDTIVTNQGDSEILLVENDTVYYRVTDRLYSAPITSKGIGTAQLLAKNDIIRDSHWAFIKH